MEKYIKNYLDYLQTEGRSAKRTCNKYEGCIREFMEYMDIQSILDLDELNYINIRTDWLLKKRDEDNLGGQSLNLRITAVKSFMGYLKGLRLIDRNAADGLKRFKVESKPKLDNIEEIGIQLLLVADDEYNKDPCYYTMRNRFMLNLLMATGLRNEEARDLKIDTINPLTGEFRVVDGKQGKSRDLCLNDYVLDMYQEYLTFRNQIWNENDYLLLSVRGNHLDQNAIGEVIKKFKKIANITDSFKPHTCRHLFATKLVESGVSLIDVAFALGHSNPTLSFKWYIHDTKNVKEIVNKNNMFTDKINNKNNISYLKLVK